MIILHNLQKLPRILLSKLIRKRRKRMGVVPIKLIIRVRSIRGLIRTIVRLLGRLLSMIFRILGRLIWANCRLLAMWPNRLLLGRLVLWKNHMILILFKASWLKNWSQSWSQMRVRKRNLIFSMKVHTVSEHSRKEKITNQGKGRIKPNMICWGADRKVKMEAEIFEVQCWEVQTVMHNFR